MNRIKSILQIMLCLAALVGIYSCGDEAEATEQYSIKTVIVDASQLTGNEPDFLQKVCDICTFKLNAKSTEAAAIALYNSQLPELETTIQNHLAQIYGSKGHTASVNVQLIDQNGKVIMSKIVATDTTIAVYDKQKYSIELTISNPGNMTEEQQAEVEKQLEESAYHWEKPMTEEDAIKNFDQTLTSYENLVNTILSPYRRKGVTGVTVDIQLLNEKKEVVKSSTYRME